MWKKTEQEPPTHQPPVQRPPARTPTPKELATIGPSISIKGDLSGDEDLTIQGRLEGKIVLKQNNVTVGQSGRVKADIYGKSIRVEGEVEGNLYGEDDVVIRASGRVQGNLVAPRVTLENGSRFKGSIDMESAQAAKKAAIPATRHAAKGVGAPVPAGPSPAPGGAPGTGPQSASPGEPRRS